MLIYLSEKQKNRFYFLGINVKKNLQIVNTTNDIMDFFLVFSEQKMYSPFIEKSRLERELKQTQVKLADREEENKAQQARIFELQHLVRNMQTSLDMKLSLKQEESQSSKEVEGLKRQEEALCLLKKELASREDQQSILHETIKQLDQEVLNLEARLHQKEKENYTLVVRIGELDDHAYVIQSQIAQLIEENKILTLQIESIKQSESKKQDLRKLSTQESEKEKLGEQNKNQENFTASKNIVDDPKKDDEHEELEKAKEALKNYDWKLFCLQTELDLWAKECKQLKITKDKLNIKIEELQILLKAKETIIADKQEENRFLVEENQKFIDAIKRSQAQTDQLMEKNCHLSEQLENNEENRELAYRLKQKNDQMNQIMSLLKQKIHELDQKRKEFLLLQNKMKTISDDYEQIQQLCSQLKQILVEKQEVIKVQQKKIEELQNSSKISQQLQKEIRTNKHNIQELISYKDCLEKELQQDKEKIIILNNTVQKLQIQLQGKFNEIMSYDSALRIYREKCNLMENQMNQLSCLQEELEHVMNKLEQVKGENFNLKVIKEQNEKQILELEDKLNRVNKNLAEQMKQMAQNQFQIQMITKENEHFKKMNNNLKEKNRKFEDSSAEVKNGVTRLVEITRLKMNELLEIIAAETEKKAEETCEFEVLGDFHEVEEKEFSIDQENIQKKSDIKSVVEKFYEELKAVSKKLQQ